MKTILAIGVGFMIARQIYGNMNKQEARKMEENMKKKLTDFMKEKGFSEQEIKKKSNEILGV